MSIYENYIASHLFPCDASKSAVCLFPMHAYLHLLCYALKYMPSCQNNTVPSSDQTNTLNLLEIYSKLVYNVIFIHTIHTI